MDGKTLRTRLRQLLNEVDGSGAIEERISYEFLNEAAIEFVQKTKILRATQSITTVADQTDYELNPDFLNLYFRDTENREYVKYVNGSDITFPLRKDYSEIYKQTSVTSVLIPNDFSIDYGGSLPSRVTSTATSAGAIAARESTLTDSTANYTTSKVSAGDIVHNTTDGSVGIALSVISNTALKTALFNGTNNDWTQNDAYVIQPQPRMKLVLDPPPSTAGHTITVEYVQRPAPVYSDYGMFNFPQQYCNAIVYYAAYLYKARADEHNVSDRLLTVFERAVGKHTAQIKDTGGVGRLIVNLKNRI